MNSYLRHHVTCSRWKENILSGNVLTILNPKKIEQLVFAYITSSCTTFTITAEEKRAYLVRHDAVVLHDVWTFLQLVLKSERSPERSTYPRSRRKYSSITSGFVLDTLCTRLNVDTGGTLKSRTTFFQHYVRPSVYFSLPTLQWDQNTTFDMKDLYCMVLARSSNFFMSWRSLGRL